jgi:hypothetical protein
MVKRNSSVVAVPALLARNDHWGMNRLQPRAARARALEG